MPKLKKLNFTNFLSTQIFFHCCSSTSVSILPHPVPRGPPIPASHPRTYPLWICPYTKCLRYNTVSLFSFVCCTTIYYRPANKHRTLCLHCGQLDEDMKTLLALSELTARWRVQCSIADPDCSIALRRTLKCGSISSQQHSLQKGHSPFRTCYANFAYLSG